MDWYSVLEYNLTVERIPIWEKGVDARYVLCLMQCIWDAVGTWNMHLAEKGMGVKKCRLIS